VTDRDIVGLDRRVDLEWLDAVACRVAAGEPQQEVRKFAFKLLEGAVRGSANNSARGKTVTVLCHIWSTVPKSCVALRDRAAKLLLEAEHDQRISIHWAMMTATYGFFEAVAEHAGRLLSLQGSFTLVQLTRRISEDWGERSTLSRAVQRIVRSMVQWGVLVDAQQKGVYRAADRPRIVTSSGCELLLESLLVNKGGSSIPVEQAERHPGFFPFTLCLSPYQLRVSPRFDVHRQGLDIDVVELLPGS